MSVLNAWQRIDRVLPGKPFGDGRDGALVISGNTTQSVANASCSGSSSGTALTLGTASTFANGDVVAIKQTRGTGVGQWEINKIVLGGGTTSLTLSKNLQYTYTDSGNSQAQIYKVPMFTDLTVNSGIDWTAPNWDGNLGGPLISAVKGTGTFIGFGKVNGGNGSASTGTPAGGTGGGFRGGSGNNNTNQTANSGEGSAGATSASTSANGNGGGAGATSGASSGAGGAGGGNGATGSNGTGAGTVGTGGSTSGTADLTSFVFGGGGGGGANDGGGSDTVGGGGSGGGGIIAFIKNLVVTGGMQANGGNGGSASADGGGAGGGAGGSILLVVQTATLGSSLITASAGSGGANGGGNGAVGRIAVHHSGVVTGTTSPSFTDVSDLTLRETGGLLAIL